MAKKIVDKDNPILRNVAKSVDVSEITSRPIQKVIADMKKALASQEDGVALAAPQIAEPYRIFVVSGKVTQLSKHTENELADAPTYPDDVYINPRLIKLSKEREDMEEGCLSVRWLYGYVKRSKKATVEAYDEHGVKFTRGASGLLAQIFQHEIDHLDGVLFIDKAQQLRESPPENDMKNT